MLMVPLDISEQLRFPVIAPRLGNPAFPAGLVQMPKASMNKDHSSQSWENQIGLPRKIGNMQPVAVTQSMNKPAHKNLWLCSLAWDATHIFRTSRRRKPVSQEMPRYTARSSGRSEMSRNRFPSVIVDIRSFASSEPHSESVSRSSGSAK